MSTFSVAAAKEAGFVFAKEPSCATIESVSLASSLIDAHAGVVSMLVFGNQPSLNCNGDYGCKADLFENLYFMISGNSTCHKVLNNTRNNTPAESGPYLDAIIPGYFLREAGQSATGKLVEQVIKMHYNDKLPSSCLQIIMSLNEQLEANDFNHQNSLIVNPTFHGNRSPVANSHLKGAIYGYTLEKTSLLDLYVATLEAIAYETRFIIEEIEKNSEPIRKIIVTGGLTKNPAYLQLHADILDVELVTFSAGEADLMLVGCSVVAFTATQVKQNDPTSKLPKLLASLRADSNGFEEHLRVFKPREANAQYHKSKYQCYRRLLDCCLQMEAILANGISP